MEILKGFSFDLQRFDGEKVTFKIGSASTQLDITTSTSNDLFYGAGKTPAFKLAAAGAGGEGYVKLATIASGEYTWDIPESVTGLTMQFDTNSATAVAYNAKVTYSDGTNSFTLGNSSTVSYSTTAGFALGTITAGVTVASGTPKFSTLTGAVDVTGGTGVEFAVADGDGTAIDVTTAIGTIKYTNVDAQKFDVTVTKTGQISGMRTGESAAVKDSAEPSATVTVAATGADSGATFATDATTKKVSVTGLAKAATVTVATEARSVFGSQLLGTATASTTDITGLTAGATLVTNSAKSNITVDSAGTSGNTTINGWTLATKAGAAGVTVTTGAGAGTGVTAITGLTTNQETLGVTFTALSDDTSLTVNGKSFTLAKNSTNVGFEFLTDTSTDVYVTGGSIVLPVNGTLKTMYNNAATDTVTLSGKGSVVVDVSSTNGRATVNSLTDGQILTVGDYKYTASKYDDKSVFVEQDNSGTKNYFIVTTGANADYDYNGLTPGTGIEKLKTGPITLTDLTGTHKYNVAGVELPSSAKDGVAAEVTAGTSTTSDKSIKVYATITDGVDLTGTTTKVEDSGTETKYTLASGSNVEAKSAKFTSTDGVVSNATGTLKLKTASDTLTAKGTVNVDATAYASTAKENVVTYVAGTDVSGATVKFSDSHKLTITETSNKNDTKISVADTTYYATVTGLDSNTKITGAVTGDTFTTVGNGKLSINGKEWTVAGDDDGVIFTADTTKAGLVSTITGLAVDGTVSVDAKFTGGAAGAITVNTTDFSNVIAKNGVTFGNDSAAGATLALSAKGDTATVAGETYTVDAIGAAAGGIVIGYGPDSGKGYLSALTDGDKITVTDSGATKSYTYEVSGKNLIVTNNKAAEGAANSKTYVLSDGETAFTIKTLSDLGGYPTAVTQVNADEGLEINANFGTPASNRTIDSIADGVYVDASGNVIGTKDKAVGKITVKDGVVKYDSQTDKAQFVNVTNNSANDEDWYITTGAGKDQGTFAANTNVSINGGAGDDVITASGNGDKILYVSAGKNDVSLGAGSGNAQVSLGSGNDTFRAAAAGVTGDVVVTAAGGNNLIDVSNVSGYVTITGSSGNDTIVAHSTENVVKGNGGNNTYIIEGDYDNNSTAETAEVKIADYAFGKDVIVASSVSGGVSVGVNNLTADGKVSLGSGKVADISATAGSFYAATLVDKNGKNAMNVAWAKDGAAKLDTSSFSKDADLFGNEDGANYLVSGAGKDVIHSYGDNDTVYGGAGNDTYSLASGKTGRVVGFSTSGGKDTVGGFNAKFEEGDSIYMLDGSFANLKATYDGTGATLKSGSAQLTFTGSGIATQSSGAGEFVINNRRAAVLAAGATASVESGSYADAYIGDNSAVNFSAVDSDLYVDLSNDLSSNGSGAKFVGIHTVVGGAGKSTLIGSAKDDLITAGTGGTSLYGGKGKDTLVGNGDYSDMFFIGGGSGMSTITSFQTSEYDNADTVKVLGNVTAAKLTNDGIEISSDSSKGIITNLVNGSVDANAKVRIESNNFTGVAKVGSASSNNSFTFEKGVGYYGGGSGEDKLAVDSSNTENAQVWLDGSQGVAYTSVDVVDFSSGSADYILVGDSAKNTISGGNGNNSLWGGVGNSVDILESSSNGTTTFFYGFGEGNDTISSNGANDAVNLYNIKLSDVKTGEITGTGVNVEFNDGSKLAVNTTRNVKFSLASGESYIANQSTKGWDQA